MAVIYLPRPISVVLFKQSSSFLFQSIEENKHDKIDYYNDRIQGVCTDLEALKNSQKLEFVLDAISSGLQVNVESLKQPEALVDPLLFFFFYSVEE